MSFEIMSPESSSTQNLNYAPQTAGDNGVNLAYRVGKKGRFEINSPSIKVGKGGAYNVTNSTTTTLDTSKLEAGIAGINTLLAGQLNQKFDPVTGLPKGGDTGDPVTDAVDNRVADQVTNGPADAKAAEKTHATNILILLGAILFIGLGALLLGRKKKS